MPGFISNTHACDATTPLQDGTPHKPLSSLKSGTIIDAGGSQLSEWMKEMLEETLLWKHGPYRASGGPQRLLPSPLLSDKAGMETWDQINRLPTYYQTDAEVELLKRRGMELASCIQPNTIIVDLGCGDVRKVLPLLDILESLERPVWYFALDLCKESLVRGMAKVANVYHYVKCFALWANFDSGLAFLNSLQADHPRLYLSLGSIFGNDHFPQAITRLASWKREALTRPGDAMLLTMDATMEEDVLWNSYHDKNGLFEKFIRNGYKKSNAVLGSEWYRDEDWRLDGVLKSDPHVHIFVLRAIKDIMCPELGLKLSKGDSIDCYEAFKFGPEQMRRQFAETGLEEIACWKAPGADIYQYLLVPSRGKST